MCAGHELALETGLNPFFLDTASRGILPVVCGSMGEAVHLVRSHIFYHLPMLNPHTGSRRAGCTDTYCAPGTRRRRTTTGAHFGRCRASEHARDHQVSERSCLCGCGPCYRRSGRLLRRRPQERSFCTQTVLRRCRGGVASSSVRTTRTTRDLQG